MKDKDLQYVLEWIAIQEQVAEYGQAIDFGRDTGDWSRWANVFTPHVTMGLDLVNGKRLV